MGLHSGTDELEGFRMNSVHAKGDLEVEHTSEAWSVVLLNDGIVY